MRPQRKVFLPSEPGCSGHHNKMDTLVWSGPDLIFLIDKFWVIQDAWRRDGFFDNLLTFSSRNNAQLAHKERREQSSQ